MIVRASIPVSSTIAWFHAITTPCLSIAKIGYWTWSMESARFASSATAVCPVRRRADDLLGALGFCLKGTVGEDLVKPHHVREVPSLCKVFSNAPLVIEKCPVTPLEEERFTLVIEHVMFDVGPGILRGQGREEFLDPLPLVLWG